MNVSDLRTLLQKIGQTPDRSLSQNFLIDQNIAAKIVRTAQIHPGDQVLEIGPGCGILTARLLKAGAHVVAIEKDAALSRELHQLQTPDTRLNSIQADFLSFDLTSLSPPLKVVANLPYHITTPIFETLLRHSSLFSSFTLMVQREFAGRITAQPSSKDFGYLALLLQFYASPPTSFNVPPTCFYPQPQIDSAVLRFDLKSPPLSNPLPLFTLIRHAFQYRRKTLPAALRAKIPPDQVMRALEKANIPNNMRPKALSLDQWLLFFSYFNRPLSQLPNSPPPQNRPFEAISVHALRPAR